MAKKKNAAPLPADADPRIAQALALVSALERGDQVEADQILDDIGRVREMTLFQEVGRLTRQLHDTLASFAVDDKLAHLTEREIPDAKERLNYVIAMTEQAANTTLNAVETLLPMAEALAGQAGELGGQWQRFRQREMPFEEFKQLSLDLAEHLAQSGQQLATMQTLLGEVLMAQGFQDLTGQIIRRVIQLVQELESNLVDMVRLSSRRYRAEGDAPEPAVPALGPCVPGVDANAVHSQDDVDGLLSSLGF
ncbi:chemotaxis protein CheZ [Methylomagnum ishizawai]|uniref:Protein phosphatase CheZ n=1 Tax=Methylomagnum ishizawai TaxID=1760988 RepID=A0A1Y6D334_9GAMM|nr:protein phosphatase CheZ [Methylomagnum ishizawai]SMF94962.1 chemotaxis protein CheZ [Methylomagnum ishizawai]